MKNKPQPQQAIYTEAGTYIIEIWFANDQIEQAFYDKCDLSEFGDYYAKGAINVHSGKRNTDNMLVVNRTYNTQEVAEHIESIITLPQHDPEADK